MHLDRADWGTIGPVSEANQPSKSHTQIVAGLVVAGVGCVLVGLAGLLLAHNSSTGRVPLSVFALLLGIGALISALVITTRNRP
jgi:hypothetical protein